MTPYNNTDTRPADTSAPKKAPKRHHKLRRAARWLIGIATAFVLLVVLAVTLVVWVLNPERLTPIIENVASEYLTADVRLDRAELTFWHTFPRLEVDVDNLHVISRALDGLTPEQRRTLPADADSLLSVRSFHGGVNILSMLVGKIKLYDLEIDSPRALLVTYDDHMANYLIVPPSEKTDTTPVSIPEISVNSFVIKGGAPIRYYSVPDSLDVMVNLNLTDLDGKDGPQYKIDVQGITDASLLSLGDLTINDLPFIINGGVRWNPSEPMRVALEDFTCGVGPVKALLNTVVDFTAELTIPEFTMKLQRLPLVDLINRLPARYKNMVAGLRTNLALEAAVKFTAPYLPGRNPIPSAHIDIAVPPCHGSFQQLSLSRLALDATVDLDGNDLDRSVVVLRNIEAQGEGVGCRLGATLTSLMSDPAIDGTFSGSVNINRLPSKLLSQLPVTVSGELIGNFDFKLRRSYLTMQQFHRIVLNGNVSLSHLQVSQSELGAEMYARLLQLKLGSNESFVNNQMRSDSLLTASLKCDTLYVALPGMTLTGRDFLVGAGCKNRALSYDKKQINPIGAVLRIKKLRFVSEADSMKVSLRDIACRASLKRFEDKARVPLLSLSLDADRLRYNDPMMRVSFRETRIDATCHPRLRPQMSAAMEARYDSIQRLHPNLRADSIYALARADARAARKAAGPRQGRRNDGTETIDYGLDRQTKNLLRWIDFTGKLKSKKARLFTPYFPVKNRLTDIDLSITPDSLILRNTKYRMGTSDFLINGTISNISQALTSRRQPIKIRLSLRSDTIDVNQIADAAFAGAAFAEKVAKGMQFDMGDSDNDELTQQIVEQAASGGKTSPIVVPMNVDAQLRVRAENIIYSDLLLHKFKGDVLVYDGAVNLNRLSATTDMGSVNMSALYTAPKRDDLSFAFGMNIKDFYIEKFMQLVPAVDTLMPLLHDIKGIINADVAATTRIDSAMNFIIPSLSAAIKVSGDSLVLMDAETFRTVAKWMLFKNKERNMIDHMEAQVVVENSVLELFPFIFDIDRYRIGVMGSNDMALNLNYHVSVLKSPIPFKFGINIKGNADKMKIRLGRAKFKDDMITEKISIADTTRINLVNQIESVFRRGIKNGRVNRLKFKRPDMSKLTEPESGDTISHADSLLFIREGVLPAPPAPPVVDPEPEATVPPKKGKRFKK